VTAVDFFQNGLYFICHTARSELAEFREFNAAIEEMWRQRDDDLQSRVDGLLTRYSPNVHREIIEAYAEELHQNQHKFPQIHRESVLITLYSFLESQMNDLCDIIADSIDSQVRYTHLKGKGVNRALNFLVRVARFDLSSMGSEWLFIKRVNQLRDLIVHNAGILRDDPKLNAFVSSNKNVWGEPGSHIRLGAGFIDEFISNLDCFFEKIDREVQRFILTVDTQ